MTKRDVVLGSLILRVTTSGDAHTLEVCDKRYKPLVKACEISQDQLWEAVRRLQGALDDVSFAGRKGNA